MVTGFVVCLTVWLVADDLGRGVLTACCLSSSGDEVDRSCVTLYSMMLCCDCMVFNSSDWCISILVVSLIYSLITRVRWLTQQLFSA